MTYKKQVKEYYPPKQAKEYYPLVDVVAPGEDWELAETLSGSDHVKRTRPRAGGGKLFVNASPDARLDKIRALLNVKFGQRSKIGNIDAPLQFVTAVENVRLDMAGWVGGAYEGFTLTDVFGDPVRQAKLAALSAMNNDGSLDLVELASRLLPVAASYRLSTTRGFSTVSDDMWEDIRGPMADEIVGPELSDPSTSAEQDIRLWARKKVFDLLEMIIRMVFFIAHNFLDYDKLPDPKETAKAAKQLYKDLLHSQPTMSEAVEGNPETEDLVKQNQKTEGQREAEQKEERRRQKRAEDAAQRQQDLERRKQQQPRSQNEQERREQENQRQRARSEAAAEQGEHQTAQTMSFSPFEMDEKDDMNRPSPWMAREEYEHNLHGRDKLVREAADEMVRDYWGNGRNYPGSFGDMVILQRPLVKTQPARIRGRANRASEFGRTLRHPHRLTTDGRVFSNKRQGAQGTVLIDNSGSMSLSADDVEAIIQLLPAATIALYSGVYIPDVDARSPALPWHTADEQGRFGGALQIIARGNKHAVPESTQWSRNGWHTIPPYLGGGYVSGGNSIDGTALLWLEKQKGPRFWVSDGQVTGADKKNSGDGTFRYRGDFVSQHLANQCAKICVRSKILRVRSMDDLRSMIEDRTIRYV